MARTRAGDFIGRYGWLLHRASDDGPTPSSCDGRRFGAASDLKLCRECLRLLVKRPELERVSEWIEPEHRQMLPGLASQPLRLFDEPDIMLLQRCATIWCP